MAVNLIIPISFESTLWEVPLSACVIHTVGATQCALLSLHHSCLGQLRLITCLNQHIGPMNPFRLGVAPHVCTPTSPISAYHSHWFWCMCVGRQEPKYRAHVVYNICTYIYLSVCAQQSHKMYVNIIEPTIICRL